jgi:radical SAM superfamily enzyme YgiQ (UPF0313 family)
MEAVSVIGVVAVDSLIYNLALMRLSAWHKAQGDRVEIAFPLAADSYDRIYRSKQFDYTPDDTVPWPCEVVSGGTGYDLTTLLTPEQDTTYPDYDLYGCDYALGRITRGCIRRCPWCVVWRQDGKVRQVAELDDFWRGQEYVRLIDDNLTAMPDLFVQTCNTLSEAGARVSFESLDVRLLTDEMCEALMRVKRWGNLHFAWDSMAEEQRVVAGIKRLKAHYPSLHDVLVYVLIGFDTTPEEDLHRVETLRSLGAMPFVMPYDNSDAYQKRFARWVNHKAVFRSVKWEDYLKGWKRCTP